MAFYRQLYILLWKSYKIRTRNPLTTLLEVLFPLILPLILVLSLRNIAKPIRLKYDIKHTKTFDPKSIDYNQYFKDATKGRNISLHYSPSNAFTDDLVSHIQKNYGIVAKKAKSADEVKENLLTVYSRSSGEGVVTGKEELVFGLLFDTIPSDQKKKCLNIL